MGAIDGSFRFTPLTCIQSNIGQFTWLIICLHQSSHSYTLWFSYSAIFISFWMIYWISLAFMPLTSYPITLGLLSIVRVHSKWCRFFQTVLPSGSVIVYEDLTNSRLEFYQSLHIFYSVARTYILEYIFLGHKIPILHN